jgi:hypothetical protein
MRPRSLLSSDRQPVNATTTRNMHRLHGDPVEDASCACVMLSLRDWRHRSGRKGGCWSSRKGLREREVESKHPGQGVSGRHGQRRGKSSRTNDIIAARRLTMKTGVMPRADREVQGRSLSAFIYITRRSGRYECTSVAPFGRRCSIWNEGVPRMVPSDTPLDTWWCGHSEKNWEKKAEKDEPWVDRRAGMSPHRVGGT